MIRQAQAARLEFRLQRLGGEWAEVSVRYVKSHRALKGLTVTWAGPGYYLHKGGVWKWLAKYIAGADVRVREIENEGIEKPPPPTPGEVIGIIMKGIGFALGLADWLPKPRKG